MCCLCEPKKSRQRSALTNPPTGCHTPWTYNRVLRDTTAAQGGCAPLCEDKELYNELWANNRGKVGGPKKHLYKNGFESIKTVNLTGIQAEYPFSIPNNDFYKSSERKTASLSRYLRRKEVLLLLNKFTL